MRTFSPKPADITRKWYLIDAENQVLGRLATKVANLLRGKGKAIFTTHVDTGDFVIVINAKKVRLTGKKAQNKVYNRYTGYPGGYITTSFKDVMKKHPERVLEHAVRGMLMKNTLGRATFRKLKVYTGPNHPHEAQKPVKLEL
jgi:large subunit ribosomal protein L13